VTAWVWGLFAFWTFSALMTIHSIGEQRKPMTSGAAIAVLVVLVIQVFVVLHIAGVIR